MKRLKTTGLWVVAVLAAGCGVERTGDVRRAPDSVVVADPPSNPTVPPDTRIELRLLGTQGQEGSTLLVGVRELRVTAAGQALPVEVAKAPMDLGNGQHAWLAGAFLVPEGTDSVRVALYLDDAGGFEDASGSGELDTRGAPLHFEAPVRLLRTRGRAVVHLDLARSLLDGGTERKVLLPQYVVSY